MFVLSGNFYSKKDLCLWDIYGPIEVLLNHDQVNFFFQYERYSIQLENVKLKNSRNHGIYSTRDYPGSGSMTLLGVSLLVLGWEASPSQGYHPQYVAGNHLYTCVKGYKARSRVSFSGKKKRHDKLKPQTHRTFAPADLEEG